MDSLFKYDYTKSSWLLQTLNFIKWINYFYQISKIYKILYTIRGFAESQNVTKYSFYNIWSKNIKCYLICIMYIHSESYLTPIL